MSKRQKWGFDTKDIERRARPQDDFYRYANGGWLARHSIPPAEPRWGTFIALRYKTEQELHAIVEELQKKKAKRGDAAQMIRDFFASGMDMKRRNALHLEPIAPYLSRIENLTSKEELPALIGDLHRVGIDVPFGVSIDQDAKNSEKYVLYFHQDGLGMPDRDYYIGKDAESTRVRTAYLPYVEGLFRLMGKTGEEAKESASTVLSVETGLAQVSMDKVERREIEKTYHRKSRALLSLLVPRFDWRSYFKRVGVVPPHYVIVMQPAYFSYINRLIQTLPLADWKTYLSFHVANDCAGALSSKFLKHRFSFYGTTLAGVKKMKPLWRQALSATNGSLGELFGQLYVQKHFPPYAKKKADALVKDLCAVYEERIKTLDWMSAKTKQRAIQKLRAMKPKIGYPSRWKSYRGLIVRPDDFFGNLMRSTEYEHRRALRKLKKPVDRKEWYCDPQVVNAFYNPSMNDMTFPAAILQPPFFDAAADDAVNYGAIGSVIGHEMTHGFDDEGAKFDSKGNLKRWWTKEDKKRFEEKGRMLIEQFNQYIVADGVKVNGKLTLGENIADLGGLMIAFDAYERHLEKSGRRDIDGFTPEQRFFLSFAKFECELIRPEYQKMLTLNDTHSPGVFRINGPLGNHDGFYAAFGVSSKDALYRAPKERAQIW